MPEIDEDGWDWTEDDSGWGERSIPRVTEIPHLDNALTPTPPVGWWKAFSYDPVIPVCSTEPASWLICIYTVQQWEAKSPLLGKCHMICRDLGGRRVLVVHPDLRPAVEDAVETLNGILTHCNCGGFDCIEPTLQSRAARVFLRRQCDGVFIDPAVLTEALQRQDVDPALLEWGALSVPRRAELIHDERLDPGAIFEDRHWLDVVQPDSGLLTALSRELSEVMEEPVTFFEASFVEYAP